MPEQGRRLARCVFLAHPTTGEALILQPGTEVTDEIAAQITNPGAWEPDDQPEPGPTLRAGELPPPSEDEGDDGTAE